MSWTLQILQWRLSAKIRKLAGPSFIHRLQSIGQVGGDGGENICDGGENICDGGENIWAQKQ